MLEQVPGAQVELGADFGGVHLGNEHLDDGWGVRGDVVDALVLGT